jgi:hypothetical protein
MPLLRRKSRIAKHFNYSFSYKTLLKVNRYGSNKKDRNRRQKKLNDTNEAVWGQVEKIGKGTKANYDPLKKTITFCFNRSPETSSDLLKKSREKLMQELKEIGYASRMKFNGEVIVDNISTEDVVLEKKNHKLIIRLNKKQTEEKGQ